MEGGACTGPRALLARAAAVDDAPPSPPAPHPRAHAPAPHSPPPTPTFRPSPPTATQCSANPRRHVGRRQWWLRRTTNASATVDSSSSSTETARPSLTSYTPRFLLQLLPSTLSHYSHAMLSSRAFRVCFTHTHLTSLCPEPGFLYNRRNAYLTPLVLSPIWPISFTRSLALCTRYTHSQPDCLHSSLACSLAVFLL